mgnify:CR=1 FL=1
MSEGVEGPGRAGSRRNAVPGKRQRQGIQEHPSGYAGGADVQELCRAEVEGGVWMCGRTWGKHAAVSLLAYLRLLRRTVQVEWAEDQVDPGASDLRLLARGQLLHEPGTGTDG